MAYAHFIDVAHVEHFQSLLVHEALLARIDAADADLTDPPRADRGDASADFDQLARTEPAQTGDRHAVQVAARRQLTRIEVSVGVEPQDAQCFAPFATVPRDGAD